MRVDSLSSLLAWSLAFFLLFLLSTLHRRLNTQKKPTVRTDKNHIRDVQPCSYAILFNYPSSNASLSMHTLIPTFPCSCAPLSQCATVHMHPSTGTPFMRCEPILIFTSIKAVFVETRKSHNIKKKAEKNVKQQKDTSGNCEQIYHGLVILF